MEWACGPVSRIFYVYICGCVHVKVSRDVDVDKMARSTTGCTGADLENMVNQAALKAAMDGDSAVKMAHMDFARDKVLMGLWFDICYGTKILHCVRKKVTP